MKKTDFGAVVTCFENLYGIEQLPGLACQRMMEQGLWIRRRRRLENSRLNADYESDGNRAVWRNDIY